MDIETLQALADRNQGWANCNQCWPMDGAPPGVFHVGTIDEDGNRYPLLMIDTEQYYAEEQGADLANYYATFNPGTVAELLRRLRAAETARIEAQADAQHLTADLNRSRLANDEGKLWSFLCRVMAKGAELAQIPEREKMRALIDAHASAFAEELLAAAPKPESSPSEPNARNKPTAEGSSA